MDQSFLRLNEIEKLGRELGFAAVGITNAQPTDYAAAYQTWIDAGQHGEMDYLAKYVEQRLDARQLIAGAQSVICVADRYHAKPTDSSEVQDQQQTKLRGRVARYAWGRDYHKVIKKRLHRMVDRLREQYSDANFKATVDTAPVLEREHAARAGLGQVGKHTLLIHPELGSWLLLGCIVTTLAFEQNNAEPKEQLKEQLKDLFASPDVCGNCTRCIDACPTDAITPFAVDATKCISYLTIEHRSLIDTRYHEAIGDWIAGCDICQEACPYNQKQDRPTWVHHDNEAAAGIEVHADYEPRPKMVDGLDLLAVLDWTEADRREAFQGSALKRIKLDMLKRNALIALANQINETNSDDPLKEKITQRIEQLGNDPLQAELMRNTAKQLLQKL